MSMAGAMTFLAMLALVAGVVVRLRARTRARTRTPALDDEFIQGIMERGQVWWEHDEPLDHRVIRQEEDRFWDEVRWDGAEQWNEDGREEDREPWKGGR